MSVGITIVELSLPEHCRDLSAEASFEDRLRRAQSLLLTQLFRIPRHFRKALCLLLKMDNDDNEGKVWFQIRRVPRRSFKQFQHYRLSASMLGFFSLPFPVVPAHNLLSHYHRVDHLLHTSLINDDGNNRLVSVDILNF